MISIRFLAATLALTLSASMMTACSPSNDVGTTAAVEASPSPSPSPHPLSETYIDVHAHATVSAESADAAAAAEALSDSGIGLNVLMAAPAAILADDHIGESSADLVSFFAAYPSQFRFMYGGTELNPLLHGAGRPDEFTEENVYPNGASGAATEEAMADMQAIVADPESYYVNFQELATGAANSGLYLGFGELGPSHSSQNSGQPDVRYPAEHEWMLWLSDLAAAHSMVLDIHMEADDETLSELGNLLAHNRSTRILWEHAGWSNTGEATAAALTSMMEQHENLYLVVKLRDPDNEYMAAAYPMDSSDVLTAEWETLLTTHRDRIMLGTDAKFWQTQRGTVYAPLDLLPLLYEPVATLLGQLDDETLGRLKWSTAIEALGL